MPWIPCVLLCVELFVSGGFQPLAIVVGAAAVAMEWFGGNPQYAFYGGIVAVLYLAGRLWQRREIGPGGAARAVGCFALIYMLGSLLAGVQLIPALELLSVSVRRDLNYAWVSQFSFVPEGLLSLLVPDIFGTALGVRYWGRWNLWEMSAYAGVVALGLTLLAVLGGSRKKALLPGCIALICLMMAMAGDALFFGLIPGFGLFRVQARWLSPMSLFVGLLAGLGADDLTQPSEEKNPARAIRPGARVPACLAAALIVLGAALCSKVESARAMWRWFMDAMLHLGGLGERPANIGQFATDQFRLVAMTSAGLNILRAGIFLAALAGLAWLTRRGRLKPAWAAGALVALIAVDAWTFGHRYLESFDPRADGLSPGAVQFLEERSGPFRFARGGCIQFPACEGMTHRLDCIEGAQPNVPARFSNLFWALQGESLYRQAVDRKFTSYFLYNPQPALLMFNLRYAIAYPSCPRMEIEGIRTVYQDPQVRIDELPDPWPRAWLVHRFAVKTDPAEVLGLLPQFNYMKMALFEQEPRCALEQPPPSAAEPAPEIERYEPARIDIKVHAAAPALLVLSDLFYPGWQATVDGRPAEILRANYLMRAVPVPEGAHAVRFLYRPASFKAGLAASAVGCVAVALLIFRHVRIRRRRGDH
jgi:hypothetical protein